MRRTVVTLISDLSGTPAEETVRFSLAGVNYEIDLTPAEAHEFRELLRRYAGAGRRIAPTGRPYRVTRVEPSGPTRKATNAAIRSWAAQQGISCPSHGRIPEAVRQQWEATRKAGDQPAAAEPPRLAEASGQGGTVLAMFKPPLVP